MADNYTATAGAGLTFRSTDAGGAHHPQVALNGATVTLFAVALVNANTEYPLVLPAVCRALMFKARNGAAFRYAFAAGKVATPTDPHWSLPVGAAYSREGIALANATIYFASSTPGTVVEIEAWS